MRSGPAQTVTVGSINSPQLTSKYFFISHAFSEFKIMLFLLC